MPLQACLAAAFCHLAVPATQRIPLHRCAQIDSGPTQCLDRVMRSSVAFRRVKTPISKYWFLQCHLRPPCPCASFGNLIGMFKIVCGLAAGGWYLEWPGYKHSGRTAWLDPAVFVLRAAFETLEAERAEAAARAALQSEGIWARLKAKLLREA